MESICGPLDLCSDVDKALGELFNNVNKEGLYKDANKDVNKEVFSKDVNKEASKGGGRVNKQKPKGTFCNDSKKEVGGEAGKQTNKEVHSNDATKQANEKVTKEKVIKESQSKVNDVGEVTKEVNIIDEEHQMLEKENVDKVNKWGKAKKVLSTQERKKVDKGKKIGPKVIKEDREIWETLKEFDVKVSVFKGGNVDKETEKDKKWGNVDQPITEKDKKKAAPVAKSQCDKKKLKDENENAPQISTRR